MLAYTISSFISIAITCIFKKRNLKILLLSCAPLFLIAALRQFVGTDYASYYYNKIPVILNNPVQLEFGFSLLGYFSVVVLGSYQWLIAGMALITCLCYWSAIFRYSRNIPLTILIFLALGCYYFSLNGMRQSVAIAIFFYALKFIEKRKLKKYLLCLLFAFSFHTTALLYIPFYWITRVRITSKQVLLVSFFLYVIYPVISSIVYPIILGKYAAYFSWGMKSGFNWRFLLPLLGLMILDYMSKMDKTVLQLQKTDYLNIIRNLSIFSFWACNLAPTLTGASAARVIYFFLPAAAIYFPYVLKLGKRVKKVVLLFFIVIFFWTTNEGVGGILPYHTIFSDYKKTYRSYIYEVNHSGDLNFKLNH